MPLKNQIKHTFQKVYRDRHLLAKSLNITDAEYRLWDLYIAGCDWDPSHIENYQTLQATDSEISKILGDKWEDTKVCRTRNKLLKKGILNRIEGTRSRYFVNLMSIDDNAKIQAKVGPVQEDDGKLQAIADLTSPNPLGSFKDKYIGIYKDIIKAEKDVHDLIVKPDSTNNPNIRWLIQEQKRLSNQRGYCEFRLEQESSEINPF